MENIQSDTINGEDYNNQSIGSSVFSAVAAYYIVLIVFGLVGNLLIIIPFIRTAALRKVTSNFFMVHMACTNLLCICSFYPITIHTFLHDGMGFWAPSLSCLIVRPILQVFFAAPAFNGMFCVALNQCLLVASPRRIHRYVCSKRPIAIFLVLFWTLGLTLFCLKVVTAHSGKQCNILEYTKDWLRKIDRFYLIVFSAVPSALIPVCYIAVICLIRMSGKRARNPSTGIAHKDTSLVVVGEKHHKRAVLPLVASALNSVSMVVTNELASDRALAFPSVPSCSYKSETKTKGISPETLAAARNTGSAGPDLVATCVTSMPTVSVTVLDAGTDVRPTASQEEHLTSRRRATRQFVTSRQAKRKSAKPGNQISKAEIRVFKVMIAMYTIVVITWVILIVNRPGAEESSMNTVLHMMGSLVPLCHTVIPYIFLWGNRNYHDVIRPNCPRTCRNRVRPT